MFKLLSLATALAAVLAGNTADRTKAFTPLTPPRNIAPCGQCPEDIAVLAAVLLVENLCAYTNIRSLGSIQNGVIGEAGTIQTILNRNGTCADSGVLPIADGLIDLIPEYSCTQLPQVTTISVDLDGKITLDAASEITWVVGDPAVETVENHYVFEPTGCGCQYRLVELTQTGLTCVN